MDDAAGETGMAISRVTHMVTANTSVSLACALSMLASLPASPPRPAGGRVFWQQLSAHALGSSRGSPS